MPQPQNIPLPLSHWHNNLTMTSRFWWLNPPSINPSTSSDDHPPAPLAASHHHRTMCGVAGSESRDKASIGTLFGGVGFIVGWVVGPAA
jgi:hypothetical protein